jgi:stage V sporulation protein R
VTELRQDGTLVLAHDHATDGRGLDVTRGNRVIQYIRRVWRRPVRLNTRRFPRRAARALGIGCGRTA